LRFQRNPLCIRDDSSIKGQKDPVQGWLPDKAAGYGGIRPIPTAVYRKSAPGTTTVLYAVYPTPKSGACPVTSLELVGDTLKVRKSGGRETLIRFQQMPASGQSNSNSPFPGS
jgi:hypothetical protein